jgi:hypothetical protein
MSISFDASSALGSASQNAASFSWSHSGGASPEGVAIFTFTFAELDILDGDNATSVTYGGVSVPAVSGGRAETINTQSSDEYDCKLWFLGSNVPTGTQTVVVNRTNNSLKMWGVALTFNSSQDSDVHSAGIVLLEDDGSVLEQSVTDGNSGTGDSLRIAGIICDTPAFQTSPGDPPSPNFLYPGANSTYRHGLDFGSDTAMVVTQTTAGTGSQNVGFLANTGYRAAVHVAIKDIVAASVSRRIFMIS